MSIEAVYRGEKGWSALIDSEVFHPGDYLPTGDLLLEVTSEGIHVQRTE